MSHGIGMLSRRAVLQAGATLTVGGRLADGGTMAFGDVHIGQQPRTELASIKAIVFDTFGTVVDWRACVTDAVAALARRTGISLDA